LNSHASKEVFFLLCKFQLLLLKWIYLRFLWHPVHCIPFLKSFTDASAHIFVLKVSSSFGVCEFLPRIIIEVDSFVVSQVISTSIICLGAFCCLILLVIFFFFPVDVLVIAQALHVELFVIYTISVILDLLGLNPPCHFNQKI
jgi:hypothetical protein